MGADTRLFRDNSSADNDIFFDRRLYPEPDLREQRLYNIISLLLNAEHRLHITYNREETVKEAENSVPPELNFINSYLNSQSVHTEANNTHLFLIRHPEDSSDVLNNSGVQQKNHTSDISFPSAFSDTEQNTGMIDFEDLCGFFENPLQWFCRKRLGIKNITPQGYKDNFYEPLALSYRQQRSLYNILKQNPADKNRQHTALNILRAGGKYPRRSLGRHYLTTAQKEMVRLYNLLPASYSYSPEPLPFHIQLGNYTLQGSLPVQQGLVFKIHAGVVSYQTLIQFCLCRLIAGQVNMSPRPSFLLTYSEKSNLTPLLVTAKLTDGNPDNLIKMLDIYREGQLSPFCIFPRNTCDNLLKILRNPDKYSPQMKTMARKYTAKIREILKNGNDTDSWNKDAADYAVQILYGGDNPAEMTYERDFKQLADCLLNGLSAESSEAEITKLLLTAQAG
ncbi:hypothetical protein CHS0354_026780 [Potamilus streckersoni]|uniref:RecC C-terminal domain-containing protein n=1 Tax=Potamilus streckersoni TaxID=2493646 RepID=A0AAE0T654_9BIVA|nr:hypothetical protein CHS0354_026780 [Potamilus streckersoni]